MGRLLSREGKVVDFFNQHRIAFAAMRSFVSFMGRVIDRVRASGISRVAASLAFTTLLGLVPLFTVAFAYVARFALFQHWLDALEPTLLRFLLPDSSATVRHYLTEFTARAADLQGISTAFVVLTAVLMLAEIESEINAIWRIPVARSLARRAIVYTLGLVGVPASIGGAVYFTSWAIQRSVEAVPIASEALPFLTLLLGLGIGTVILTLIYVLVPARRVPLRAALIAGLLAAIAFDVAKSGFTFYITHFSSYQVVYGALAALPVFLIWVYVSWIILLVGAAVAATLAESDDSRSTPAQ
jgi:membrane protein